MLHNDSTMGAFLLCLAMAGANFGREMCTRSLRSPSETLKTGTPKTPPKFITLFLIAQW